MNIHKNAALSLRGREQMIKRLEDGESVAAASAAGQRADGPEVAPAASFGGPGGFDGPQFAAPPLTPSGPTHIERVGHRIHGDRSKTVEGAGWEYLHVCIDDASRVSYAEVLPNERGVTCAAFLHRAAAWLRRCGVRVERVMTDNGSGYISKVFRAAIRRLGARHIRPRPYTPP